MAGVDVTHVLFGQGEATLTQVVRETTQQRDVLPRQTSHNELVHATVLALTLPTRLERVLKALKVRFGNVLRELQTKVVNVPAAPVGKFQVVRTLINDLGTQVSHVRQDVTQVGWLKAVKRQSNATAGRAFRARDVYIRSFVALHGFETLNVGNRVVRSEIVLVGRWESLTPQPTTLRYGVAQTF